MKETAATPLPNITFSGELSPTTDQWRDTIKNVVAKVADDVISNIVALRRQIDELEQLVLSNAARVSDNLNEHASICGSVKQEIARLTGVVDTMRKSQLENASEFTGRIINHATADR